MGKIFKKIKKTVKKVSRPLGKIFKKIGGGIAKAGKYVYDGVVKIGGKALQAYNKFSQKLGPIGMIGMSIAMPYLLGAFSGTAGGLWTNFGTKMGGVVSKSGAVLQKGLMHSQNPFLKVIGHAGKGIYNASNFIGGTTRGITQTITKTFGEFAQGNVAEGFSKLYRGTSDVLSGRAGMGTMNYIDAIKAANVGGNLSGIQLATENVGTLVQTGGVNLGNVNIGNRFAYDSIRNAMTNTLGTLSPDALKYHRTLVKNIGLDDRTAYQYITKNGVDAQTGFLDKSLSGDFFEHGGVGEFNWTGANIDKTTSAFDLQSGGGFHYKPKVDGEIFQTEASLLNRDKGYGKKILKAMKDNLFGDDGQEPLPYVNGIDAYAAANLNSRWLGSNMSYAGGNFFLTDEHKKHFANIKQKKLMDIGQ